MVSDIIDPNVGLPVNQQKVLEEMRTWLSSGKIVKCIVENGVATKEQLSKVIIRVLATYDNLPGKLTDAETAVLALRFLGSRLVRRAIAKKRAVSLGINPQEAMKGLWEFKEWLESHYGVTEHGSVEH